MEKLTSDQGRMKETFKQYTEQIMKNPTKRPEQDDLAMEKVRTLHTLQRDKYK